MKKYIVDLSGRLVRNSPTGWFGTDIKGGGLGRPHIADRRHETPMNTFEKVICLIFAGGAALFALAWLWEFWEHR